MGKSYNVSSNDDHGYINPSFAEAQINGQYKSNDGVIVVDNGADIKQKSKEDAPSVSNTNEAKKAKVGIIELFRFGNKKDRVLIVLGIIAACAHGCLLPMTTVVFGNLSSTLIDNDKFSGFWDDHGATIGQTCNITKEAAIDKPETLKDCLDTNPQLDAILKNFDDLLSDDFNDQVMTAVYWYIGIACASLLLGYIQVTCWEISAYRQCQRIRTLLFKSILKQEIGWFDVHETGELNSRLVDDVNKIQDGIGDKLGQFFQFVAQFLAGYVVGFVRGWELTLVILSVAPLLVVSAAFLLSLGTKFSAKTQKAYAKAGAVAEEVISSIRTVAAFGGEKKECERYNSNLNEAKKNGIQKGLFTGGSLGFVFFIMFCSYGLGFWYGAKLVREEPDDYNGGKILTIFFAVLMGTVALGRAAPNMEFVATARGSAYTVYNLIDQVPSIDSSSDSGKKLSNVTGDIQFKDIHFRYPSRPDSKILKGIDLSVNVGQTVALVGSSGCGKSTTVQLLQRFYDPEQGQVLLDGHDIRDLNVKWLRQNIGVVGQEPILFAMTIADNIRYGRDGVTQQEIQQAARNANAHDFISKLPMKYETMVGERGAQLSGGQKQRIAIARALVRNPKILLLDEATSALDTESESIVQSALDNARQGRTTLVIAHRLSTIRTADLIVAFDHGEVKEQGTHDELMAIENGIYHTLVTNQSTKEEEEEDDEKIKEVEKEFLRSTSILSTTEVEDGSKQKLTRMQSFRRTISAMSGLTPLKEPEYNVSMMRIMNLNRSEWYYMVVGCISAMCNGAVQPCMAILLSEMIGVFSLTDIDEQEDEANFYALMFIVLAVGAGTVTFLQNACFSASGECLTMRVRQRTFKALLRQDIGYFDDPKNSTGALCTRLSQDATNIQGASGVRLGMLFQSIAGITTGLTIGFVFSWQLALMILGITPLLIISAFIQTTVVMGASNKDKEALENAGKTAIEAIENMRTVAALTKEEKFYNDYCEKTLGPYKENIKNSNITGIAFGFSEAVRFFAMAAIWKYGAYLIEEGDLNFEDMFKVFGAILFSAQAVGQATSFAPDYGKAKSAAGAIFYLLDREPPIDVYSESGTKLNEIQGTVHFNDLYFNYPTRPTVAVLQGLELSVNPGQTLALVGSSGCGKSTTIQLIQRFYDPLKGLVLLDGNDMSEMNTAWLREQLGIVSQEPVLFDTTIAANIAYGDNNRDVAMDEIIQAAKSANVHDFISALPMGYDTGVGEKGAQLSGGQKQRIAIARALVRNPKILLLDEATSALDTESEKVVQEALEKAQEGRTSIVIAHRLSTIRNADCIAVIHKGKLAEMGTHRELMDMKGKYYKLNNTQTKK